MFPISLNYILAPSNYLFSCFLNSLDVSHYEKKTSFNIISTHQTPYYLVEHLSFDLALAICKFANIAKSQSASAMYSHCSFSLKKKSDFNVCLCTCIRYAVSHQFVHSMLDVGYSILLFPRRLVGLDYVMDDAHIRR